MTTTIERPKSKKKSPSGAQKGKGGLLAPALPQVNLLPPEVHAARGLVRVKRWLAIAVLLAVVVASGVVALAWLSEQTAQQELAAEQKETARLEEQKQQYAKLPVVLADLKTAKDARALGMSTEVLWPGYLSAMAAVSPPGVSIQNFAVSGVTPTQAAPIPLDVLQAPSVTTITFTTESLTSPDTASWLDGLETIPGFADAWFTTATAAEREGTTFYTVTASVQLNEQAFAERFAPDEEVQQ